ncbi:phage terminase large subunit family protein [Roseospira goensis]|uniref:Phage terminase large subunit GpA-like protein n=1 Tax=Roseospira goensis TaxID=391922 RepID=A0A7W6S4A2_9PROT|nr:phage terminase large subunit family protein [Roseospira goensis]MBB4287859.1 phage terminase large subunit GpA-like protein [Roseospira goensis]
MLDDAAAWCWDAYRRQAAPPPLLTVSEWADTHRRLTSKSAAEPGPWRTDRTPYLRAIMDALSPHARWQRVVFVKGAQLGGTEAGNNFLAYLIHWHPGPIMAVQPTVEGAKRWSRQRLDDLVEAPPLAGLVRDPRSRDSGNTTLLKEFPGGLLVVTGGNSAVGLRSMPVRFLFLDEVDAYPIDADGEGDPIDLAVQRTATFGHRRKVFLVSTPTIEGHSRIERAYQESDQRRFWVPCPHCGEFQVLTWDQMRWTEGAPETAFYACAHNGCVIVNADKATMLPRGEWRAEADGDGETAGFHISSLYSPVGWLSWADLARDHEKAKDSPARMQVFVNTKLGETWRDQGEAPAWEPLWERRGGYTAGEVPEGVAVLTAGADVQPDRIEVEVVGWGEGFESWSISTHVLDGPPEGAEVWKALDQVVRHTWRRQGGGDAMTIQRIAIDSGFLTPAVYRWVGKTGQKLAMAIKGRSNMLTALGTATRTEVTGAGRRARTRGVRVWTVGVDLLKGELYGRLRLTRGDDGAFPPGYCHFPDGYEAEYFKQLTAEELVTGTNRKGYETREWRKTRPRNEALDCRVYATAALLALGAARWGPAEWEARRQANAGGLPLSAPMPAPHVAAEGGVASTDVTRTGTDTANAVRASARPAVIRSSWLG